MRLLSRLKLAFNQSSWDDYLRRWMSGSETTPSGEINVYGDAALRFSAAFACCRVLAETFATVPFFEYQKSADGDRQKTDDTGLYDILHNVFNDEMSAFSAKETAMYQLNLGGNAVFERLKNKIGDTVGLYPYNWQRVKIERDDQDKLIYKIHKDGKEVKTLRRDQVLHVPGPSLDGVIGMSPIEYAAAAIRLGLTYESFGNNFYKNGIFTSGTFTCPGSLGDDAYRRLKESIKAEWTGHEKKGVPLLLEGGTEFKQLGMKLADAELLASKKFQTEEVCRFYRVPLHLIQNLDRATNNNIEHQSLEFVMYTMLPVFKRWEDCINMQLLTREQRSRGYYYEANLAVLLRGDSKSMAEAFAIGRQWGWLSVNDIRRLLNMNRIDNGDIYLQPMNMIESGKQLIEDQKKEIVEDVLKLIDARGQ